MFFVVLFHHVVNGLLDFSKWQTKDQPVVAEEALAAVVGAVGVVLGGDQGEESQRTKTYVQMTLSVLWSSNSVGV